MLVRISGLQKMPQLSRPEETQISAMFFCVFFFFFFSEEWRDWHLKVLECCLAHQKGGLTCPNCHGSTCAFQRKSFQAASERWSVHIQGNDKLLKKENLEVQEGTICTNTLEEISALVLSVLDSLTVQKKDTCTISTSISTCMYFQAHTHTHTHAQRHIIYNRYRSDHTI